MTLASDLGILPDGNDCTPDFDAAMADAAVSTVEFEPGHYCFGSQAEIASGKSIRGCGRATVFSPLSTFAPRDHLLNGLISTAPNSEEVSVSCITLDGMEIGHGGETEDRIHGCVMRRTLGFRVRDVVSMNWSGYAFLVSGDDPPDLLNPDLHCSGVIEDCRAENSDLLYEIGMCRGVIVRRCYGSDGKGTIHAEDAFLTWNGAEDVLFEDIGYSGTAGSGFKVCTVGLKATKDVVVRRAHVRMAGNTVALRGGYSEPADAAFRNSLKVYDSEFSSALSAGAHLFNVDGVFCRTRINGYSVGCGLETTSSIAFEDSHITASNAVSSGQNAHALRFEAGSSATITRGSLRSKGYSPVAYIKNSAATLTLAASPNAPVLEP